MTFTDDQVRALNRRVPARRVKTRFSDGKELSYIEGWFALDQANRIFGFDGWDRETIETRRLFERNHENNCLAVYSARVRLTVRCGDRTTIRDGHGTGEARANSVGEAHDRALKAAETDATKRALATFGKAFGLALYAGLASKPAPQPPKTAAKPASPTTSGFAAGKGASVEPPAADFDDQWMTPHPIRANGVVPRIPIDKSALAFPEPRRVRDKEHLKFVAAQPCILCSATPSDAHHVRFAQPRAMSRKVSDEFTVPLCRNHHRELHASGNEASWWHDMGIDPLEIAKDLWLESGRSDATNRTAPG
jgi:hypothetical protein